MTNLKKDRNHQHKEFNCKYYLLMSLWEKGRIFFKVFQEKDQNNLQERRW